MLVLEYLEFLFYFALEDYLVFFAYLENLAYSGVLAYAFFFLIENSVWLFQS
jgi:hypothetical protein